jgi:uncharacterized protein (TIGR02001 family)
MVCLPSVAQEDWGGSLSVTSDYRVRGISQTVDEAAVQGGLHARFDRGWLVGAWGSTIDRYRGPSAELELDLYLGFAWNIAPDWDGKVLVTHYAYPNDPATADYDYDEVALSLAYRSQLVATIVWSPNTTYFGRNPHAATWAAENGTTLAYELTGLQPLTSWLALSAGVGYNDLGELFYTGYWYWNAGLSCSFGALQVDLARIDSDAVAAQLFGDTTTEAGWSAAVSWRF